MELFSVVESSEFIRMSAELRVVRVHQDVCGAFVRVHQEVCGAFVRLVLRPRVVGVRESSGRRFRVESLGFIRSGTFDQYLTEDGIIGLLSGWQVAIVGVDARDARRLKWSRRSRRKNRPSYVVSSRRDSMQCTGIVH